MHGEIEADPRTIYQFAPKDDQRLGNIPCLAALDLSGHGLERRSANRQRG